MTRHRPPQTILDGHLQHFEAETSAQSSNLIKAALGLHSQVCLDTKEDPRAAPVFIIPDQA